MCVIKFHCKNNNSCLISCCILYCGFSRYILYIGLVLLLIFNPLIYKSAEDALIKIARPKAQKIQWILNWAFKLLVVILDWVKHSGKDKQLKLIAVLILSLQLKVTRLLQSYDLKGSGLVKENWSGPLYPQGILLQYFLSIFFSGGRAGEERETQLCPTLSFLSLQILNVEKEIWKVKLWTWKNKPAFDLPNSRKTVLLKSLTSWKILRTPRHECTQNVS